MPPKRGRTSKASFSKAAQAPKKTKTTRAKRPKPAKTTTETPASDHSAQNDAEILRAFSLFAGLKSDVDENEGDEDDGEGVIKIVDVRRCLSTLNLPKPPSDFFDDPDQIYLSRDEFLALARTLRETISSAPSSNGDVESDGDGGGFVEAQEEDDEEAKEVAHAFSLFTHNRQGTNVRITLADLKRVAMDLREDVDEGTLRMMIEEANGEMGKESVGRGVSLIEFEEVMRRAGVFG